MLDMASHGIEAARYLFGKDQVVRDAFVAPHDVLRVKWRRHLTEEPLIEYKPQEFAAAAVSPRGLVYVGSSDRTFVALRARDGELVCQACGAPRFAYELADGTRYLVDTSTAALVEGPNAARVEQYAPDTGAPALITDNSSIIKDLLTTRPSPAKVIDGVDPNPSVWIGGGGCSATGIGSSAVLALLGVAVGLRPVSRRFRRRRGRIRGSGC